MELMSWLGHTYFYLLFFPFIYWTLSRRLGILAAYGLLTANYAGDFIKWVLKLPRPPSSAIVSLWHETSPGFVSTHAAVSMGMWGTLAIEVRRRWLSILAGFMIFFIGLSRLYLGVHYPADVVGGWLVGLLTIWVVFNLSSRLAPQIAQWSASRQIAMALCLAFVMLLVFPGNYYGQRPAEAGVLNTAVLLGFNLGLIWDQHQLNYRPHGAWRYRLIRYGLGLLLLLLVYFGLSALFSPDRKSTRLNSSHIPLSRMPSSA